MEWNLIVSLNILIFKLVLSKVNYWKIFGRKYVRNFQASAIPIMRFELKEINVTVTQKYTNTS